MTRIMVISNCQTDIMCEILRYAVRDAECTGHQIPELADKDFVIDLAARVVDYDHVFHIDLNNWTHPEALPALLAALEKNSAPILPVSFNGFHPDICALQATDGAHLASPAAFYHSLICVAGFLAGYDEERILATYNALTYRRLGYFETFDVARLAMIAEFGALGLDVAPAFTEWLKRGVFMYAPTHPHSFVLETMIKLAGRKAGIEIADAPFADFFPDHLAFDAVLSVYPEIARPHGVQGGYAFKPSSSIGRKVLSLQEFVAGSCRIYRQLDPRDFVQTDRIRGALELFGGPAAAGVPLVKQA